MRKALTLLALCIGVCAVAAAVPPALPKFPALVFHPPTPERWVMDNGLVVYFLEDHELPLIKATLLLHAGSQYDPADKVGLGSIFATVWTEGGTLTRKPEAIELALQRKAASVSFDMELEKCSGEFSCRTQDFGAVFDIFSDLLLHPLFRKDRFNLAKSKAQEGLRRMNDDPQELSRREFRRVVYGPNHPYARTPSPATVDAIKREDLQQLYAQYVHPNGAYLALSGDFKTAELKVKLQQALAAWRRAETSYPVIPPITAAPQRAVYYIQKELNQSQIRIGHTGFARHNPDHFAWEVFNELWGGSSTSLLFRKVRTQEGLAYDVGTTSSEPAEKGLIVAICQTRGPQTVASAQAILKLSDEAAHAPFSNAEIDAAKESLRNRFVENYDSSFKIVSEVAELDYFGYPKDYLATYTAHLGNVSADDLRRVAKTYLHPDQATLLVVGDLSTFDKPLSTLGKPQEVKPPDYADPNSVLYPTVH